MVLALQVPLLAQGDQDPPGRVARLSYSVGSVSFQPGGTGDWVQAVRNRPLTTGDNLWADKDSRAEIQVGSTSLRIDSETSITILELDDHVTQIRLSQGSVILRVRHLDDEDHLEIDTPNSAFRVRRTGEYRVDVNSDGSQAYATVWKGRGEVVGGGSSFLVVAGQRASFTGSDQLNHEIDQIPPPDDFDNWAFDRDRGEDRAEAANYISPEMTGYEDLDDYGSWRYVAGYGPVWTPVGIAPGWAPYRFGHWVWVAPWGWTWVEDEPWGFAPFHYGRWAYVGDAWCWVPGPVYVRPVYAPALVVFVGGGGFAFGFGPGVAWFPLAPREVFVPWYRTSPTYVNNVNITNTTTNITNITNVYNTYNTNNITNINNIHYANRNVPNGVTAVSHDAFVNARPVASNLAKIDPKEIQAAPIMRNVEAQPGKQSVLGAGRPTAAKPPASVENRPVVATRQPSVPRPPLAQREPATGSRPMTPAQPEPARAANQPPRPESQVPRPSEPGSVPAPRTEQPTPPREGVRTAPTEAARPEGAVPRPPGSEWGHPLVRQAPPVEEKPEFQRSEEQKFNTWQQHRSQAVPRPAEAPRPAEPPRPHK
jgi:hypothetical protein